MKILQINNVYNRGSTGKITYDIHNFLKKEGIDSVVCYGRGKKEKSEDVYKTSSEVFAKFNALRARITGLQYNGSWVATNKILRVLKKEQPDIVHLQCINGNFVNIYRLLNYLKKNKFKVVLTLHAEFMHTGSCGHAYECESWKIGCGDCPQLWLATKSYWFDRTDLAWIKMNNAFDGFQNLKIIAVSKWLEDRAKQSPIMKEHSFGVIHNGIDTDSTFKPTDYKYLKQKHELQDEKILLYVTPSFTLKEDDIKGGHYVIQLAKRFKAKNIKIIVIGGRDLSIELPSNVINVGRINNQQELAAYYTMADLTLLTSKRETYSMVCAESLSCGTPVIGFRAGAPETIALKDYSEFVEYGDVDRLEETVDKWIQKKIDISADIISRNAKPKYSKTEMGLEYLKVYNQLYQLT